MLPVSHPTLGPHADHTCTAVTAASVSAYLLSRLGPEAPEVSPNRWRTAWRRGAVHCWVFLQNVHQVQVHTEVTPWQRLWVKVGYGCSTQEFQGFEGKLMTFTVVQKLSSEEL